MDRAVTIAFNDWLYAKADAYAKLVPPVLYLLGELEIHPDRLVHPRLLRMANHEIFFRKPTGLFSTILRETCGSSK